MTLRVRWVDLGREPQEKPNPDYPEGIDVDIDPMRQPRCSTALGYPAPRCGYHLIRCDVCGASAAVTTAGRPDDPRRLTIPCKVSKH